MINSQKLHLNNFPQTVEVEVNKGCNLAKVCLHCPNFYNPAAVNVEYMDKSMFLRIIRNLRAIGFEGKFRYHRYGEPLLRRDLEELVALTKKFLPNSIPQLYTNGILLTKERLESLLKAGIEGIFVTQHTTKGFIDRISDFPDKLLEKVSFRYINEVQLYNRGGFLEKIGQEKLSINDPRCFIPEEAVIFTIKGKILPCYDDYNESLSMGNLHEKNLRQIWESHNYKIFRDQLRNGERINKICEQCNRTPDHQSFNKDETKSVLLRKTIGMNLQLDNNETHHP